MPGWFRLGQIAAVSSSSLERGEESLRKYLTYRPRENEPGTGSAYYYLGYILEKQGRKTEAHQTYAGLKLSLASKSRRTR